MSRPSVIFCNLQNSGGSAVDPILREIFARSGYFIAPYGPEGTRRLRPEMDCGKITHPFYHWTHDPIETFADMVGNCKYRFIYLHRDPRDAAVSWAHDFQHKGICGDMSFSQILEMVVTHNLPPHVRSAIGWVRTDCLVITFKEVKENIAATVHSILDYANYYNSTENIKLSDAAVDEIIDKHSFESMAGRQRGESGEIVRSGYMLRKGISGEWKKQFTPRLTDKCNEIMGREILELGYGLYDANLDNNKEGQFTTPFQVDDSTSIASGVAQIVSPPFSCGVAWLVNALLYLDIRVTNTSFEPGHWGINRDSWQISGAAETHLKWHLPVLHERQSFQFPESLEVRWEHRLDFAACERRPTILFVRDPRDAVYSLYRRNYADSMGFIGYLNRPDEWPHHFPGLFQMPPLESYAYFCCYWLAMGKIMPVKLVRFEDVKANPSLILKEVLQYLGVERSDAQIQEAVKSSGFDQARLAMEKMEASSGKLFMTARKGQVGEWRVSYSTLARLNIRKLTKDLIRRLGYDLSFSPTPSHQLFEDYLKQVDRSFPKYLRANIMALLLATEKGSPPSFAELAAMTEKFSGNGTNVLKFGAITEAIYYVQRIFSDTSSPPARIALNVFVNLNLFFFNQWPVQIAAWYGLCRIELDSGVPVLRNLGKYHNVRLRILNRIWKLF
jgi:Sulfotransferase domain